MPSASDTHGSVFERGSAVLLARVTNADGEPVEQSDVSSLAYTISQLDPCSGQRVAVSGHEAVALPVASTVFDTMQTGGPWDVDATGYNFRHEIDVSVDEAFPNAGRVYQVRYELTPVVGQRVVFRFQLRAI